MRILSGSRTENAPLRRHFAHFHSGHLLPCVPVMRNRKAAWTQLYAHREDEAFEILTGLETLFARMFPSRGSRWLRIRLHKASARLAEIIIISAGVKELGPM